MSTFLDDLNDRIVRALVDKLGVSESTARSIVAEISSGICADFGGQEHYLPKAPKKEVNRAAVVKTYLDEGPGAVRDRFGMSRATLYRLLKRD